MIVDGLKKAIQANSPQKKAYVTTLISYKIDIKA